jgi:hypothetical protein
MLLPVLSMGCHTELNYYGITSPYAADIRKLSYNISMKFD